MHSERHGSPRPRSRRGRVIAGGALILAPLLTTGCGGPGATEEIVGTSTPTPAVSAEETSIFQLSSGQCYDRPASDDLYAVEVVPCSVAHDLEAYALFQLEEPTWPGDDRVHDLADAGCRTEFSVFTGAAPEDSDLGYTMYTPSSGSWSEGDRQVLCALQLNSGGRLIGSQAGHAGRG
jgi:Septum formation